MTPAEAAFTLSQLTASFNQHPFQGDDPRGLIWIEEFAPLNHRDALEAIRQLRRSHDRLPSVAAFLGAYEEAVLRRRDRERPLALPEATGQPCRPPDGFLRWREGLVKPERRKGEPAPVGWSLP